MSGFIFLKNVQLREEDAKNEATNRGDENVSRYIYTCWNLSPIKRSV